jgi:hypothetical protein
MFDTNKDRLFSILLLVWPNLSMVMGFLYSSISAQYVNLAFTGILILILIVSKASKKFEVWLNKKIGKLNK